MLRRSRGLVRVRLLPAVVIILVCVAGIATRAKEPTSASRRAEVLFSPGGGCESRIVQAIESAEKSIRVQMYMFTSKPVSDALMAARKRSVEVTVILDKSQEKMAYGRFPVMRRAGVKVLFDREHETANSKTMLIDRRVILTGSYNFTKAAEEKNAETLVVIENDGELFEKFLVNFEDHLKHSHAGG